MLDFVHDVLLANESKSKYYGRWCGLVAGVNWAMVNLASYPNTGLGTKPRVLATKLTPPVNFRNT